MSQVYQRSQKNNELQEQEDQERLETPEEVSSLEDNSVNYWQYRQQREERRQQQLQQTQIPPRRQAYRQQSSMTTATTASSYSAHSTDNNTYDMYSNAGFTAGNTSENNTNDNNVMNINNVKHAMASQSSSQLHTEDDDVFAVLSYLDVNDPEEDDASRTMNAAKKVEPLSVVNNGEEGLPTSNSNLSSSTSSSSFQNTSNASNPRTTPIPGVPSQGSGPQYNSSFAPSKSAAERKAKAQVAQAAAIYRPGGRATTAPGGFGGSKGGGTRKMRAVPNMNKPGSWSSEEEEGVEEEEEDDDDEGDVDSDEAPKVGGKTGLKAGSRENEDGQGQISQWRPLRTFPQIPGRMGEGDQYSAQSGPPRSNYFDDQPPPQLTQQMRSQSQYGLLPPISTPGMGAPRQSIPAIGRGGNDLFVQLKPASTHLTKAFTPQGLLLAEVDFVDIDVVFQRFIVEMGGDDITNARGWSRDSLHARAKAIQKKQRAGHVAPPTTPYTPRTMSREPSSSMEVPDFTPRNRRPFPLKNPVLLPLPGGSTAPFSSIPEDVVEEPRRHKVPSTLLAPRYSHLLHEAVAISRELAIPMVLVDILLGHLLVLVPLSRHLLILEHRLTNDSAPRLYLLILRWPIQSDPHRIDKRVKLRLGEVTLVEELVVTPMELQAQENEAAFPLSPSGTFSPGDSPSGGCFLAESGSSSPEDTRLPRTDYDLVDSISCTERGDFGDDNDTEGEDTVIEETDNNDDEGNFVTTIIKRTCWKVASKAQVELPTPKKGYSKRWIEEFEDDKEYADCAIQYNPLACWRSLALFLVRVVFCSSIWPSSGWRMLIPL
ncbi:hypothetical protein C8J55DRAFT_579026 [Lentinula edodes]|uniref:Uncharacterized protein n=1 Tax=Lentinula lateritia TaxID=40482 RepID=A0A9W9A3X8_9AGAR|nr:hypothetical protein C8J55DRAFT_579026 [Lentinula edodes]